jgi:RpiR family carbohydrate utilization transcriptional regulator
MLAKRPGVLDEITRLRETMSPAQTRVAEFVAASPGMIPLMNVASVATAAQVSEPTVIRFCRELGCRGFPEFKIRIAQDLASERPYLPQPINFNDSVTDAFEKIVGSNTFGLNSLRESIDPHALEEAVAALDRARRIEIYAEGLSSVVVAAAAQRTFTFLEMTATFYPEPALQLIAALNLTSEDVALCISFTGYNAHVLKCAKTAAKRGARIVSVTRSDTALADLSSIGLTVDTIESVYLYSQISTRIAQLTVVDVLATGVALRRGPTIRSKISNSQEKTGGRWIADV